MSIDASTTIHPSAVIEDGAIIGPDCKVGPFCLVGANVTLAKGVELFSHVVIAGHTSIGDGTRVWPNASVGHQPQDLKYNGETTYLEIGARCMIREGVSISPGTAGGTGITKIGDECLLMLGSHVGHDSVLGDRVILANHASIAGHVNIGNDVIIGGLSGVHQFVNIGSGAIVGTVTAVVNDVIPYGMAVAQRAELSGLNLIGLKRRGVDRATINDLRKSFTEIFEGEGTLKERATQARGKYAGNALVMEIVDFLLADNSRSFLLPNHDE